MRAAREERKRTARRARAAEANMASDAKRNRKGKESVVESVLARMCWGWAQEKGKGCETGGRS